MAFQFKLIPIYTTRGDLGAFLAYPYIYNPSGEWIGWVTPERDVYSVYGGYVGWLGKGPRILRKQADSFGRVRQSVPQPPEPIRPPARVSLAPMMPELPMGIIDVLDEDPDLMPCLDFGEERMDLE
ncbi:MAG: hypothetical protein R6V73_11115 [Anaerolineales bacterium]|jgi:hypothetical protein